MIFITVGSQKFQFNRLIQAVDELVKSGVIQDRVFAQTGYCDYLPESFEYCRFLDRDQFAGEIEKADIVITHGGTGVIVRAVKSGKKVIAVPRLAQYGEHVDDHQIQLIEEFSNQNLIHGLKDCSRIQEALEYVKTHEFAQYVSNTDAIINSITEYIERNG